MRTSVMLQDSRISSPIIWILHVMRGLLLGRTVVGVLFCFGVLQHSRDDSVVLAAATAPAFVHNHGNRFLTKESFVSRHARRRRRIDFISTDKWWSPSKASRIGVNGSNNTADENDSVVGIDVPSFVRAPSLKQVYPAMVEHNRQYGNPNIPLGDRNGRLCQNIRLLKSQNKLLQEEIDLLENLGFRWEISLEDAYDTFEFDDMYTRLQDYARKHDGDVSPPKKYPSDPELGAWVTCIRRLGRDQMIDPQHVTKLDEINFQWVSQRKCGSQFMIQYRAIMNQIDDASSNSNNTNTEDREAAIKSVFQDTTVQKFIKAQQEAMKRGTLSETRQHYMSQLLSNIVDATMVDWIEWQP